MDSSDTNSVIGVLITGAILLTLCIVLGLVKICCRSSHPSDPKTQLAYPVAISNRLFNVCKCLFHCINRWLKTKCEILNFNVLIFVVIEIQKEERLLEGWRQPVRFTNFLAEMRSCCFGSPTTFIVENVRKMPNRMG